MPLISGTAAPEMKMEENVDGCELREKTQKLSCEERKNGNGRAKKNSVITSGFYAKNQF